MGAGPPTLSQMADAVAEAASREVTIIEGIRSGILIGPDPADKDAIAWRAECLVAAHAELRRRAGREGGKHAHQRNHR